MNTATVLILSVNVRPGLEKAFFDWQLEYHKAIASFPGFSSSDVIPPPNDASNDWTIVLNFASNRDLTDWNDSLQSKKLAVVAQRFLNGTDLVQSVSEVAATEAQGSSVTEAIFSSVKPGMEEAYRDWTFKIQAAQAKYPGYRGTYLQPPTTSRGRNWTTLLRYASASELERWMSSSERAQLLKESRQFIDNEEYMQFGTAFPGWVPVRQKDGETASAWKIAFLVLLGLFPVVMLEIGFLSPQLSKLHWNVSVETFIGNAISVALTSFITVPMFIKWFDWWLFPMKEKSKSIMVKGVLVLAALFALEIVFFAWLFN